MSTKIIVQGVTHNLLLLFKYNAIVFILIIQNNVIIKCNDKITFEALPCRFVPSDDVVPHTTVLDLSKSKRLWAIINFK